MRRASLVGLVIGLGVLLALPPTLYVNIANGGAPPVESEGGGTEWRPVVTSWRLLAATPESGDAGVACSHERACDPARLDALADDDAACTWDARIWLTSSFGGHPVALRDVSLFAAVFITSGGREPGEAYHYYAEYPLEWTAGWWWRAESEHVRVSAPVPCDAREVKVALNYQGNALTGREVQLAQAAEVMLAPRATGDGA